MFRWIKNIKKEIESLKDSYCELEAKYNELQETINSQEWLDTWHQYLANRDVAGKSMQFQLMSKTDVQLLEYVIQQCNRDPDLAVLLRTADGAILTLRSHPQPQVKDSLIDYRKYSEQEK